MFGSDYVCVSVCVRGLFTGNSAAAQNWSTQRNCSNTVSLAEACRRRSCARVCAVKAADLINYLIT